MTKEELEKEAEEYARDTYEMCSYQGLPYASDRRARQQAFLAGAEPREKRIAELEKENKVLAQNLEDTEIVNKALEKENAELKEELKDANKKVVHLACNQNKDLKRKINKAKELLNEFVRISKASDEDFEHDYSELIGETEQFLNEVEK